MQRDEAGLWQRGGAASFFRTIVSGRETLSPGYDLPRHRHLEPYALVVIAGAFEQTSYAGRVMVSAGDVLVQPTLDCHANRLSSRGAQILRLPWTHVEGAGGVHRLRDLDAVVRLAARDVRAASELVRSEVALSDPVDGESDWPDMLARDICRGRAAGWPTGRSATGWRWRRSRAASPGSTAWRRRAFVWSGRRAGRGCASSGRMTRWPALLRGPDLPTRRT